MTRLEKIADLERTKPIIFAKYATTDTAELAQECGCSIPVLHQRARYMGVKKCRKLFAAQVSARMKKARHGFKVGQKPKKATPLKRIQNMLEHHIELFKAGGFQIEFVARNILQQISQDKDGKFDFLTVQDMR